MKPSPDTMGRFLHRSLRTTAAVAACVALGLWAHLGGGAALAFLDGVAIGVLMFAGTAIAVEGVVRPPAERAQMRWPYYAVHLGKFGVVVVLVWLVYRWDPKLLPWVALGYSLPLTVIVLRFAGRGLNRRLGI